MGSLYVPDRAYLVCSDGMKTQQIKVNSQSSIKIVKGRLAATIKDRTGDNFVCAKMVIAGAIIGVIVAAIVAAAIVLSGGTLAIGLGAMLAAGAVGGAAMGLNAAMMPCICAMLTMPKDWTPVHPRVTFEDKKALIDKSIVPCLLGGSVQILYSKEAAEAMASLNRSKAIASVAAIASIAYIAGVTISALTTSIIAVKGTFVTYGALSGSLHLAGMAGVGGASYGVNSLYDWAKDATGIDKYITGDAYAQGDNGYNQIDDITDMATNKNLGAPTDALGSATDISKSQVSDLNRSVQVTQTSSSSNVFIANSNGGVSAPGTTYSQQTTVSSNQILGSSPARTGVNSISVQNVDYVRVTPNTTETIRSSTITTNSTQFNNSSILKGSFSAFAGKYGFNIAKGIGTNAVLDLVRACGNWIIADDLKDLQNALNNSESAARNAITVLEDEV
ncbi:PAAR-like protein [Pedobacter sp. N23S346]|uniref:PAAR-like protein n=1 Tax=Pedobacter sp. N23S346 TaxID=3402750 RepID=UPI003AD27C29